MRLCVTVLVCAIVLFLPSCITIVGPTTTVMAEWDFDPAAGGDDGGYEECGDEWGEECGDEWGDYGERGDAHADVPASVPAAEDPEGDRMQALYDVMEADCSTLSDVLCELNARWRDKDHSLHYAYSHKRYDADFERDESAAGRANDWALDAILAEFEAKRAADDASFFPPPSSQKLSPAQQAFIKGVAAQAKKIAGEFERLEREEAQRLKRARKHQADKARARAAAAGERAGSPRAGVAGVGVAVEGGPGEDAGAAAATATATVAADDACGEAGGDGLLAGSLAAAAAAAAAGGGEASSVNSWALSLASANEGTLCSGGVEEVNIFQPIRLTSRVAAELSPACSALSELSAEGGLEGSFARTAAPAMLSPCASPPPCPVFPAALESGAVAWQPPRLTDARELSPT